MSVRAEIVRLGRAPRRAVAATLLALALCAPLMRSAETTAPRLVVTNRASAEMTNWPVAKISPPSVETPMPAPAKRKVGILAGAGLIALSLLALAVGLALLRAFKQR